MKSAEMAKKLKTRFFSTSRALTVVKQQYLPNKSCLPLP
jgi:hypothetical protein